MIPDVLIVFADESALRNIGTYVRPYETPCEVADKVVGTLSRGQVYRKSEKSLPHDAGIRC